MRVAAAFAFVVAVMVVAILATQGGPRALGAEEMAAVTGGACMDCLARCACTPQDCPITKKTRIHCNVTNQCKVADPGSETCYDCAFQNSYCKKTESYTVWGCLDQATVSTEFDAGRCSIANPVSCAG
mgnify:CR=1 FL=1